MEVIDTNIPEVKIIIPKLYGDSRGYFMETFQKQHFEEHLEKTDFVQNNESFSQYGVLRGLHYQRPPCAQGKLVRVIKGEVLDVAVDVRLGSPSFGQHVSVVLNEENKKQLWIPRGFAHGFVVLSDTALFSYHCDNYYAPEYDAGLLWNDKDIAIDWGIPENDIKLSEKDKVQPTLSEVKSFKHFSYTKNSKVIFKCLKY